MAGVRFVDLVRPFAAYLPEVAAPQRKIAFAQRLLWTLVVLLIFLVMSEVPLYGIVSSNTSDPFMWLRTMLASNRGTLMELGITPVVSSGMVVQLITASGLIKIQSDDPAEREMLKAFSKLLAIILSVGQATTYVLTGMYGPPKSLGSGVCLLLVVQLVFAAFVVILLDELLQVGYGLGSGISLFVATNTCEQVLWKGFSPNTVHSQRGYEFEGAVIALVHIVATRKQRRLSFMGALHHAFTRTTLPNMSQVLVTVALFFVVLYAQSLKVELPVRSTKARGTIGKFPVSLFYTSNMPIMLQSAAASNIVLLSQLAFSHYPKSIVTRVLGVWESSRTNSGQLSAVSGLAYYIQPPQSWHEVSRDPVKAVIYVVYVMGICAAFSRLWLDISGTGPRDVARKFREEGLTIMSGQDSSVYRELKRYITTAATVGGAAIGLLAVSSDLLGTLYPGTGILLAVTTIYGYVETATKEGGLTL